MDTIETQSRSLFDLFPIEIIFSIFDYLSSNDIIFTFFFFNQRFNNLLLQNKRYLDYLELPRTNLNFWKNLLSIISSDIKTLNITSVDVSLPLTYFPKLESLIISSPHGFPDEELQRIFNSDLYENLHSFHVKAIQVNGGIGSTIYQDITSVGYVLEKVFNNRNSLRKFEYLLKTSPLKIKSSTIFETNLNLQSLTLWLTDFKDIYTLLLYTPNLQCLHLQSEPPYRPQISLEKIDINLKKLTVKLFDPKQRYKFYNYFFEQVDIEQLINFIQQFSSTLFYFSLNLSDMLMEHMEHTDIDDLLFNDNKLQQFLEPMIKLKQFHLIASVYNNRMDHNSILSKFNNQFWLNHNWSFGIYNDYLFTLPFHFDVFRELECTDGKSNDLEILDNDKIRNSIKTISLLIQSKFDSDLLEKVQRKFRKLSTIYFPVFSAKENLLEDFNPKKLCLNSVTAASFDQRYFTAREVEILEDQKDWLIYILPNLKYLTLSLRQLSSIENELIPILNNKIQHLEIIFDLSADDFERLIEQCYKYFSNVQYIYIRSEESYCMSEREANIYVEILKNFKNFKALLIYNLREIKRDYATWYTFIENDGFQEIKEMFEVKVFKRHILFSKLIYKT